MQPISAPRGTRDILPAQAAVWNHVKDVAEQVASSMGYKPITVPTYEEIGLFSRAIGAGTDIQDKELFLVRGVRSDSAEEQYALRPEGTAGIVRAYIQNGMVTWPQPVKLFTFVNNFRYDRPQKGRYREHVQFDIEYFGDGGPFADAWVIYTTWRFLSALGLDNLELKLNTLGTSQERATYKEALIKYYQPIVHDLSPDSQKRLHSNPLRLLDSKEAVDKAARDGAPRITGHLEEESLKHFESVQNYLTAWKVPYVLDPFLVRGLDYYSHTAFEWTVQTSTGQQDSLGGGGRYDGLVEQLGGRPTGAVGAGLGLDRVVEEMDRQGLSEAITLPAPRAFIIAVDEAGRTATPEIIDTLLAAGISLDCNLSKDSMGAQLKAAGKSGAKYAVLVGGEELSRGEILIKNMEDSLQIAVARDELPKILKAHA